MNTRMIQGIVMNSLRVLILAAILNTFMIVNSFCFAGNECQVHYALSKSTYMTAELIPLSATFLNSSGRTVSYIRDSLWQIVMVDKNGHQQQFRGPEVTITETVTRDISGKVIDPSGIELPPYSKGTVAARNLCDLFGEGDGIFDFYISPGEYRIWNSYYRSDTLEFSVVDPTEPLEREAMEVLTRTLNDRYTKLVGYEAQYKFYSEFYRKYSGTCYAERALRAIGWFHPAWTPGFSDSAYQAYTRTLLLRFPNSPLAFEAIPLLKPEYLPYAERDSLRAVISRRAPELPTERQRDAAKKLITELEK